MSPTVGRRVKGWDGEECNLLPPSLFPSAAGGAWDQAQEPQGFLQTAGRQEGSEELQPRLVKRGAPNTLGLGSSWLAGEPQAHMWGFPGQGSLWQNGLWEERLFQFGFWSRSFSLQKIHKYETPEVKNHFLTFANKSKYKFLSFFFLIAKVLINQEIS